MAKSQKELNQYFKRLKSATKEIHLDVSDGRFVHSKSLWFNLKLSNNFHYNAHLMIKNPERWIKNNLHKIDIFIPHIEELKKPREYINWMEKKKKKVAFALRPETDISWVKHYLKEMDYVLILTVHPGRYGGKFLKAPLAKIKLIKKINPKVKVIVDGGMCLETIGSAAKAGADFFVSGSFTSCSEHPKARIKELLKYL